MFTGVAELGLWHVALALDAGPGALQVLSAAFLAGAHQLYIPAVLVRVGDATLSSTRPAMSTTERSLAYPDAVSQGACTNRHDVG